MENEKDQVALKVKWKEDVKDKDQAGNKEKPKGSPMEVDPKEDKSKVLLSACFIPFYHVCF